MDYGFVSLTYSGRYGSDVPYSAYVPRSYDASRPAPLVLFLHGAGEGGTDGRLPVTVGLGPHLPQHEQQFPALVVFPQSQRGGWHAGAEESDRALDILEQVRGLYAVDPARMHLTGISMGGYGTWSIAIARPELWASIVPVCGGGDTRQAHRIKDIPCWCFHGEADDVIPVEASREMVEALHAAGGHPRYTEFRGVRHNSWDPAYSMDELYAWWAAQHR